MQIYLLGLMLVALAVTLVAIVRLVIGRRRAGEPWLAFGPEGAKREPVFKVAPKPVLTQARVATYLDPAPETPSPRAGPGLGKRSFPGGDPAAAPRMPGRLPAQQLPPRPKAAPEGALAADVEARLAWALDLLQSGKIPLESYVRIVESERDQAKIKLARLNEDGSTDTDQRASLNAALEALGWCLDWAEVRARAA